MVKQDQRREKTRARLLEAARDLFLENGYAATTTQMILRETNLSKGAMYHHFESKADLFEALYVETSQMAINAAVASVHELASPFERFKASALVWLQEIRKPQVARLILELGPEALGWAQAKAIEDEYSLPLMRAGLQAAQDAGEINVASIDVTARFINAMLAEAAFIYLEKGEAAWPEILQGLDEAFARLKSD